MLPYHGILSVLLNNSKQIQMSYASHSPIKSNCLINHKTYIQLKTQISFIDHLKATFQVITLLIVVVLLSASLTSCNSKSGQLDKIPYEKVIIIDSAPDNGQPMIKGVKKYKVRRIEKSVVTFIIFDNGYECGDTILYRFIH